MFSILTWLPVLKRFNNYPNVDTVNEAKSTQIQFINNYNYNTIHWQSIFGRAITTFRRSKDDKNYSIWWIIRSPYTTHVYLYLKVYTIVLDKTSVTEFLNWSKFRKTRCSVEWSPWLLERCTCFSWSKCLSNMSFNVVRILLVQQIECNL